MAGSTCYFYLGELVLHNTLGGPAHSSPFMQMVCMPSIPCIQRWACCSYSLRRAAYAKAVALPSACLCLLHSSYSNSLASCGPQGFTTYFTMLVNFYCFSTLPYYVWWNLFPCFEDLTATVCVTLSVTAVSQLPALNLQF